ncbi:methyltransferase domain-containing protein [Cognatishimia sp. SS12]|uniref:methyltransferase domain-containing protein n=1 Tax=Cognatishimia sp. SS12 TaxID=2979465 RepID=UPI00232C196F|nr:methyltransferase domain-containing protein [Cognatishimia sp. SS12]MDC0738455.1 methyltransferase domain-containing protein [Cognatishimia sp. SS12]
MTDLSRRPALPRPSQTKVQQSFRRGLDSYHQAATHQADIAAQLGHRLSDLAPKHLGRVLEFGAGTGHLTQQITKRLSIETLWINDLVPESAGFAPPEATFLPGPIETLVLPGKLDLICSASTVQWIEDLPGTIKRLCAHLAPGGWIALSGFGAAQFHELRELGSTAAAPSYVDAEAWRDVLPSDMTIKHLSQGRQVAWFADARALLRHLRETGVNGGASQHWGPQALKTFESDYRRRFGTPQGLPLTYDPVWVIARKS